MTDRIPKLMIDRHFLELSETCLYAYIWSILGLGPFSESWKNCSNIRLLKSNPKLQANPLNGLYAFRQYVIKSFFWQNSFTKEVVFYKMCVTKTEFRLKIYCKLKNKRFLGSASSKRLRELPINTKMSALINPI